LHTSGRLDADFDDIFKRFSVPAATKVDRFTCNTTQPDEILSYFNLIDKKFNKENLGEILVAFIDFFGYRKSISCGHHAP
jgi:hypothetical protein